MSRYRVIETALISIMARMILTVLIAYQTTLDAIGLRIWSATMRKRQSSRNSMRDPASYDQDLNLRKFAPQSEIKIPTQLLKDQAALFASRRGIGLETEADAKIQINHNAIAIAGSLLILLPPLHPRVKRSSRATNSITRSRTPRPRSRSHPKHARSVEDIFEMQEAKLPVLPDQRAALQHSRKNLDAFNPHYSKDLEQAYMGDRSLAQETTEIRGALSRSYR